MIDSTDTLLEILSVDFNICNKDTKVSYNKILAKADIEIRILYLLENRRNKKIRRNYSNYGIHRFGKRFGRKYL